VYKVCEVTFGSRGAKYKAIIEEKQLPIFLHINIGKFYCWIIAAIQKGLCNVAEATAVVRQGLAWAPEG
jgi:hypothetical protein